MITKQAVAEKIAAYLHHQTSPAELVEWAEVAIMEGEFDELDIDVLRTVVSRLGLADVRAFGLEWDDCEQLLHQFGYSPGWISSRLRNPSKRPRAHAIHEN